MIAAAAPAAPATTGVAAVIVIVRVAPSWSWIDGLHRDLGSGLSCGVKGLSPGVVLCPELHCGLHGDLGLLGKAMAAVGGRGAAVAWGRRAIRGRWGAIGWGRAVATPICPIQVRMRLDLDHTIGTWADEIKTVEKCQTEDCYERKCINKTQHGMHNLFCHSNGFLY